MIPCPYCGGTPTLMQYRGVIAHRKCFAYRMTCSSCGASTLDCCTRNFAKWAWDRGDVMKMTLIDDPDIGEVDG